MVWRPAGAVLTLIVAAGGYVISAETLTALAQPASPAFDVAVVKRTPLKPVVPFQVRPGRVVATAVTLRDLIVRAYGVRAWNLVGAPGWIATERFDIEATFQEPSTPAQVNAMLRTLLERRFRLVARTETRDMATDVIVLDTAGRLGPGFHPVRVDCETKQLLEGSGPGVFPAGDTRPPCGMVVIGMSMGRGGSPVSKRQYTMVAYSMTDLAGIVAGERGRPAYDGTGLTGQFDIELTFVPDADAVLMANAGKVIDAPRFDVALHEQLGLGLKQERRPVEQLIVTSVELPRPDEN